MYSIFFSSIAFFTVGCAESGSTENPVIPASQIQDIAPDDTIYYFYSDTCPHCSEVNEYMTKNNIVKKYNIYKLETSKNPDFGTKLEQLGENYGVSQKNVVPTMFYGGEYVIGSDPIIEVFENQDMTNFEK